MRKLGIAMAMATGLLLSLGSGAHAAVVTENIGTLDAGHPSASYGFDPVTAPNFHLDGAGQGTFQVDFSLGNMSTNTATSITASAAGSTALKDFTFGLYDSSNTLLKQVDQSSAVYTSSGTTFSFLGLANLLTTGSYHLLLAVASGNANQLINGNISIAAVPIPASLPMFGAALIGLMIIQMRRRQRTDMV
jgi:hypothetical protein